MSTSHTKRKHQYKENFLTNVIFRIDFKRSNNFLSQEKILQEHLKQQFPKIERKPVKTQQFKFDIKDQKIVTDSSETGFVLTFSNENSTLEISDSYIVVEEKKYRSHDLFRKTIEAVLTSCSPYSNGINVVRCGFRYINQINIDKNMPYQLDGYIDQNLLSSLSFNPNKAPIIRAMNVTEFVLNEDVKMKFQYGIYNKFYPNIPLKKEYILDFDCYTGSIINMDKNYILSFLDQYNKLMAEYFEAAIDSKLREEMHEETTK